MRPSKQATDSNFELTLWCKTRHPHTNESKFQLRLCSGLTMWPCKQASDWMFKHEAAPRGGQMSPQGWKMLQKKRDLLLDLAGPWKGLGAETPPNSWTFWCKIHIFNFPLKKISTQAQLWQELISSKASFRLKIRAHTLMQDTTSSFKQIKIPTQALLRLDHEALQASYRLKFWTHTLMQDTASLY
jgi:hypothetical protein